MSIQLMSRCGVALFLVALVSGCSLLGFGDEGSTEGGRKNECTWNRSSCMYEGRYEQGEEDYAEEEAARLNREAAAKLRRGW